MIDNGTPLSSRETALLSTWERERKSSVTLNEFRQLLGPRAATTTVTRLVRKGLLERISRGVYIIHPFRSLARPHAVSSAVAAATILAEEPYYLGGWWAFSLHHLTQQHYASRLDAYVTREHRPRLLGQARLVFHVLPATGFTYGVETTSLEGTQVQVSDAARTLLDALDYPKHFGGIRAALRLVSLAMPRVDRELLVSYAARGSRSTTCQRLGILLERLGAPPRALMPLRPRVRETTTLLSMLPDAPRTGPVNATWRVVENDRNTAQVNGARLELP